MKNKHVELQEWDGSMYVEIDGKLHKIVRWIENDLFEVAVVLHPDAN
jgi:hypothetical protein